MKSVKTVGKMIVGLAIGTMALPFVAFAAAPTAGLVALNLQGVGTATVAGPGSCVTPAITCPGGDVCFCASGAATVLGNQGFANGSVNFTLLVDQSADYLPIANVGVGCATVAGTGTIANKNGRNTLAVDVSGFSCPTFDGNFSTLNATYFVTGGTGKYSSNTTGVGAINGGFSSSVEATGSPTSYVSVTGTVQK
jgi:hypothetical protein